MARPAVTSTLDTIGNTPVVKLSRVVPAGSADVFVKLESFNPTGSYKDRFARAMIEGAEARGELRPGMRVVEYSAGSTGSSLAFVCAVKGYPPYPDRYIGCVCPREIAHDGGIWRPVGDRSQRHRSNHPDLIPRMMDEAKRIAGEPNVFWTNQFHNPDLLDGYRAIGTELLAQIGAPINAFCCAVGTAGMFLGTTDALRKAGSTARLVVFEPASAPLISKGTLGSHGVEGIAVGIVQPVSRRTPMTKPAPSTRPNRGQWRAAWLARRASLPARRRVSMSLARSR